MCILSAAEMQACDRITTERFGIPSIELMRAAARACAKFAREQFPQARRITVLCGRGNNGGDGMMTAQLLSAAGLEVATILLGSPHDLQGDAAVAWLELSASAQGVIRIVESPEELAQQSGALAADLIIDAVLGTGFKPPMRGLALAALDWVRRSKAPILAVDLPSGWPADETAAVIDLPAFPADAVITFTAPKPAHVFGQLTRRWDQPVVVAPIGSPDEAVVSSLALDWAGSSYALVEAPRAADSHKGSFGHVLIVGGSVGKSGAPAMASMAALRSGAGLVTAAVPMPVLAQVACFAPELMTYPLLASHAGRIAAENLSAAQLKTLTQGITVLAIGPGLGQGPETTKFMLGLLGATRMPVVIDADALNILAAERVDIAALARGRTLVLTPHPGEMARLAGVPTAEIQAHRLEVACGFAQRNGVTLVLKGARTLIAHADGRVAVNTSGNPGMAKGGSGDMLTGIIAGLLAQYPHAQAQAIEAAVYLHGLAADLAVRDIGERSLLATDSLSYFSQAFRFGIHSRNGYVWLQGAAHAAPPVGIAQ